MSVFKVQVQKFDEVDKLFREVQRCFAPRLIQQAILPAARIIRDEARNRVSIGPGVDVMGYPREHLRDAIFAVNGRPGDPSVIAGISLKRMPHAHLVEFGTEPHTIYPKKRGRLLRIAGKVFARFVHHPGAKAKPFFRPAIRTSRKAVASEIEYQLRKLLGSRLRGKFGQIGAEFE